MPVDELAGAGVAASVRAAEQRADMPTVLIVEPNPSGHRLYYVRLLLAVAADVGIDAVVLTTEAAVRSREFAVHIGPMRMTSGIRTRRARRYGFSAATVARCAQEAGADLVVVPDADRFMPAWLAHGATSADTSPSARLLLMRPPTSHRRSTRGFIVAGAKKLLVRSADRSGRVEATLFLVGPGQPIQSEIPVDRLVKDPVKVRHHHGARDNLRRDLGLPRDGYLFAILGSVTARKHPDLVAGAVSSLSARRSVHLLVAGTVSPATIEQMQATCHPIQQGGPLIIRDGYVDDDTFDRYLAATDCLVLAYGNTGSSGLLAKAVQAGVPVLCAGSPGLSAYVEQTGAGIASDLSPNALCEAMLKMLERPRFGTDVDTLSANDQRHGSLSDSERAFALRLLGWA